jgi:hypothetical protein
VSQTGSARYVEDGCALTVELLRNDFFACFAASEEATFQGHQEKAQPLIKQALTHPCSP